MKKSNLNQKGNSNSGAVVLAVSVLFGLMLAVFPTFVIFTVAIQPDIKMFAFHPEPAPDLTGKASSLDDSWTLLNMDAHGPESVELNSKNDLYFSTKGGEIRMLKNADLTKPSSSAASVAATELIVSTGGRPLGVAVDRDDNILIADAVKGLLKYDIKSEELTILVTSFNGSKLNFINDVVTNKADGMIYFTNSIDYAPVFDRNGDWNTERSSIYASMAVVTTGQLLSYNPVTKETKILLDSIAYANGLSIDDDAQSIYMTETGKFKIHKYWISGPDAGKHTVLINNLPGYPDGIKLGPDNKLYIAIFGMRKPLIDKLQPYPLVKKIIFSIPYFDSLFAKIMDAGVLVADSNTGEFIQLLKSNKNKISDATILNDKLIVGNLVEPFVGLYDLKKVA